MGCANSCQKRETFKLTSQIEPVVPETDNPAFSTEDEGQHLLQTAREREDAIAIVGIGCRTPGADNIRDFWRVLVNGECHVTDVPAHRWNAAAFLDADPTALGKAYVQKGGFIKDIEGFDNSLYGISDYEASQMDPQQCLLLDCTSMALQDAGITRKQLSASNTGVYIGSMNPDHRSSSLGMSSKTGSYTASSNASSFLSGRLSYVFNLLGPSMTIDTACSASLIAIHLGRQAILTGDCDQAICGGINCMLLPDVFVHLSKARMISPTGLCHTFSDKADGYTRGEGCGVVILKRLTDALRDGDKIWATVYTGTNQDGRTVTPVTAPSGEQQKNLLQSVYDKFQVDLCQLDYIEAHGTGTPTGDPVEVNALGSFLKEKGQPRQRFIGSVKTNIGHTESAAGALSVIKLCLMMKHNTIVPSLHCDVVNPSISLTDLRFTIPKCTVPWSTQDKVCCCNSFGFGGSNCHAIVKSFSKQRARKDQADGPCIVCFSGKSVTSLKGSLEDLIQDEESSELNIHDVSYTSTLRRDHHLFRAAFLVEDMEDLVHAVAQRLSYDQWPQPSPPHQQTVVFVFCGMGTSWDGMCRQLLEHHEVFKDTLMEVEKLLSAYVPWSLTERLRKEDPSKDLLLEPIAVFACQVGLAKAWRSLGIVPGCVVGQSIGEVAAAYTAGCFSLADAVKIIYHRSQLLAEATGGAMIVVLNVEVEKVKKVLTECDSSASVSQEYSSKACAVSAPSDIMPTIKRSLQKKLDPVLTGMRIKDLNVHVAYHSPHVKSCAENLVNELKGIAARPPSIPMQSTVTGISLTTSPDAEYWARNLRDPVLFKQAVTGSVKGSSKAVFLEIGPHPVLKSHLKDLFPGQKVAAVPSMLKSLEMDALLKAAISLYEEGLDISWSAIPSKGSEITEVPRYCLNKKYQAEKTETHHMLLSGLDIYQKNHLYTCPVRDSKTSFRLMISPLVIPSVYDHVLSGKIIVPGAFLAEASLAVAHYHHMARPAVSIEFEHATSLKKGEVTDIVAEFDTFEKAPGSDLPPLVIKRENRRLASAHLRESRPSTQPVVNLDYIRSKCREVLDKNAIYSVLKTFGFQYGPTYSLLEQARKTSGECLALLELTESVQSETASTRLHPSVLDCMLQSSALVITDNGHLNHVILPKSIGHLVLHGPVEPTMYVYTRLKRVSTKQCVFDLQLLSSTGQVIASLADFVLHFLQTQTQESVTVLPTTQWTRIMDTPALLSKDGALDVQGKTAFLFVTDEDTIQKNGHATAVSYLNMGTVEIVVKKIREIMVNQSSSLLGVVFVCSADIGCNTDSSTIQDRVVTMCSLIQSIMQTMKELFLNVALYVCTFNAWPSAAAADTDSNQTNPVATALWGLVRTIIMERGHNCITAVDLSQGFKAGSLPAVFSCLAETEGVKDYPEVMITPESVFVNQVVKDSSSPLFTHLQSLAEDDQVREQKHKIPADCPQALDDQLQTSTSDQTPVLLKLQDFVLGSDELFSGKQAQNSQPSAADSRQTPVAIEMKGLSLQRPDVEVVCCCPVKVKPEVAVPAETVVPTSLIPDYQLGDLTKLVVLWEMHSIVQRQGLTILASTATLHFAELLQMICIASDENKTLSVDIVLLEKLGKLSDFSGNVLSLVYMDTNLTSFIAEHWQRAKHFVTYTSLMSPEACTVMMCDRPDVTLTLLNFQTLLQPGNLRSTVPKLQSWMKSNESRTKEIAQILHRTIKTNTVDLNELLQFHKPTAENSTWNIEIGFKKDAAYIVVGGLTGLGWICVEYLACRNAGYIAIINRSSPSAEKAADINSLSKKYSCQIKAYQADITRIESVRNVFRQVESTSFQLRGVFMGAAVLKDSPFLAMTSEDFQKVLSPKIKGAWNLHQLTKTMALDYFVLHSSIVSVFGNPGQANYVVGNSFLDGLAWYRHHLGLAAHTINWGPLNTGLLDHQDALKQKMESSGFHILGRPEVTKTLAAVLDLKQTQTVPVRMNPKLFGRTLYSTVEQPIVLRFKKFASPVNADNQGMAHSSIDVSSVRSLSPEKRYEVYKKYVQEIVSHLLVVEVAQVSPDVSLISMGMDSMSGTRLLDEIRRDTGFHIPAVEVVTEKTTIASLALVLNQNASGTDQNTQL